MTGDRPLSILLVTQFAPPAGFSAARRAAGLAKYLGRQGHRVTVLTSLASGRGEMAEAARVIRTRDLTASGLNWRRKHFESMRGGGGATSGGGYVDRPSRLASVAVPDLMVIAWAPFALARALRVVREEPVDCVITSSPPESAHLVGLALKRQTGTPWVADLRDGWTFESTHPEWPTALQSGLDGALERAVTRNADLVTTVTDPISDDLRARTGARVRTLTNGFDPEERVEASKRDIGLAEDRFSLVYTGRFGYARGRRPTALLDALSLLRVERPNVADRLEVVFAGPLTDAERRQMTGEDVRDMVRVRDNLPRAETLALQRAADALLIVLPPTQSRSMATAKLYEYLATSRPILVLGEHNAAADIVRETGSGVVTSADDRKLIAQALAQLVDGDSDWSLENRTGVDRYGYPQIAAELAKEISSIAPGR